MGLYFSAEKSGFAQWILLPVQDVGQIPESGGGDQGGYEYESQGAEFNTLETGCSFFLVRDRAAKTHRILAK